MNESLKPLLKNPVMSEWNISIQLFVKSQDMQYRASGSRMIKPGIYIVTE